jgi:hypothetical protein
MEKVQNLFVRFINTKGVIYSPKPKNQPSIQSSNLGNLTTGYSLIWSKYLVGQLDFSAGKSGFPNSNYYKAIWPQIKPVLEHPPKLLRLRPEIESILEVVSFRTT